MKPLEQAMQEILEKDYAAEYESAGDKIDWMGARKSFEIAVLAVQEDIAFALAALEPCDICHTFRHSEEQHRMSLTFHGLLADLRSTVEFWEIEAAGIEEGDL